MRRFQLPGLLILATLLFSMEALGQNRLLTLDDLYNPDPQGRVNLNGNPPMMGMWLDERNLLQMKGRSVWGGKVNVLTGRAEAFYDEARAEAAFGKLPGISAEQAKRLAGLPGARLNEKKTGALLNVANDLFYYELGKETAIRLTNTAEPEVGEEFSPDGRLISFVRNYNLYVVDLATQRERSLTKDGGERLFNGRLDWVYQEEVYGRGNYQGYWWSPDSTKIVYLQLDESPVRDFTIVDHIPNQQDLEIYDYPKSGMPNPNARIGWVSAFGGETTWFDTFKYQSVEPLIVRAGWRPDSGKVWFCVTNREQSWLDFNFGDLATGKAATAFRETEAKWIESDNLSQPEWLKDGSFLWLSERSGWKHLYHYSSDCKSVRAVTTGKWEAQRLHGVDEAGGWIYFSGTERSQIGSDAYRIRLDGSGLQRLTETPGTHQASFNPSFTHFIDVWSDAWTPTQTRLHTADGKLVRVIDENKVAALSEFKLSKPEYLQVKTRDGFPMEAMLLRPVDFDPKKKYPVFIQTYAGPHAPMVRNAWWIGMGDPWHQLLAQKGYIVWICDNRSASGKGAEATWTSFHNFGEPELRDIEDGVSYLKSLPYVDSARIGINGWSFGGYMTSFALTHSTSFKMGIAGAPVTDWHLYDSIYTERYMGTPQNNPEGYERSSVIKAAKNLSGKLLLIHGAIDDNVHMQNSIQLIYELEKAGKQFNFMVYPKSRHGVADPKLVRHMREMMLDFILKNL